MVTLYVRFVDFVVSGPARGRSLRTSENKTRKAFLSHRPGMISSSTRGSGGGISEVHMAYAMFWEIDFRILYFYPMEYV